jgi:hypothetical protein
MKNLAQLHEIPGSRRTKNQIEGDEWDKIYLSTHYKKNQMCQSKSLPFFK